MTLQSYKQETKLFHPARSWDLKGKLTAGGIAFENRIAEFDFVGHQTMRLEMTKRMASRAFEGMLEDTAGETSIETLIKSDSTFDILEYHPDSAAGNFIVGPFDMRSLTTDTAPGVVSLSGEARSNGDVIIGQWLTGVGADISNVQTFTVTGGNYGAGAVAVMLIYDAVEGDTIGKGHTFTVTLAGSPDYSIQFTAPDYFDNVAGAFALLRGFLVDRSRNRVPAGATGDLTFVNDTNGSDYELWKAPNRLGIGYEWEL